MQRRLAVFCEFTLNRLTPPKLCYIGGLRNHPLKKTAAGPTWRGIISWVTAS